MPSGSLIRGNINDNAPYQKEEFFAYHYEDFSHSTSELRKLLSNEVNFSRRECNIILLTLLCSSTLRTRIHAKVLETIGFCLVLDLYEAVEDFTVFDIIRNTNNESDDRL